MNSENIVIFIVTLALLTCVGAAATAADTPEDDVGEPKTLEELIAFAEENAPDIHRARERTGLGEAALDEARRVQTSNPELEGRVGVGVEGGGVAEYEVGVSQRLEVAGERGLRVDVAQSRSDVLVAELHRARWETMQRVHHLYRMGLLRQRRVAIERRSVEFGDELSDIAEEQVDAGEEPETSAVVARAERARARQRLAKARTEHRRTLRELAATIGWPADEPPRPDGEVDALAEDPSGDELLDRARENDPQLALLDAQIERARAELRVAEREVWPSPRLGLGFEREGLHGAAPESKLQVMLGIPLPIWDRNQGERGEAMTRIDLFERARADRVVVLENRVREHLEALEGAREQVDAFEGEVLPALERQLDLLEEGFELGELSLIDVVDARDRLLEVERKHLEALRAYFTALGELEETVGTSLTDEDQR